MDFDVTIKSIFSGAKSTSTYQIEVLSVMWWNFVGCNFHLPPTTSAGGNEQILILKTRTYNMSYLKISFYSEYIPEFTTE